jgi:hypothetical protein
MRNMGDQKLYYGASYKNEKYESGVGRTAPRKLQLFRLENLAQLCPGNLRNGKSPPNGE